MRSIDAEAKDAAAAIAALAMRVFESVDLVESAVRSIFDEAEARGVALVSADLMRLGELCESIVLSESPVIQGIGFNAERDALADRHYAIAFWRRNGEGPILDNPPETDPEKADYYEYEHLDWFENAREGRQRSVAGPYVDYGGTDDYTLTFAGAVSASVGFVGVVAADVAFSVVEQGFAPHMLRVSGPCVVLNRDDRIVVSNRAEYSPGSLLAQARQWRQVLCESTGLGWTLCYIEEG